MILNITYRGENTSNIGYLFCKNPSKFQEFDIPFGKAYVFFPKVTEPETTCTLLLDLNSIDLAKGKVDVNKEIYYTLFDYINDRPFTSNSFMSSAISKVFSSALKGKCKDKPEMIDQKLHLITEIINMPIKLKNKEFVKDIFEPLGYSVSYVQRELNSNFSSWGEGDYLGIYLIIFIY